MVKTSAVLSVGRAALALLAALCVPAFAGSAKPSAPSYPINAKDVARPSGAVAEERAARTTPRTWRRLPAASQLVSPARFLSEPGILDVSCPPIIGASFVGMAQGSAIPPDPDLTVGPNHVAHVVNLRLRITNKTGTEQYLSILTSAAGNFWAGMGVTGFTSDPKVMYDQYNDRFVVAMIEVANDFSGSALLLAVSATSNPTTGVWNRYRTVSTTNVGGTNYWTDYTSLGLDQQGIYFCANLYNAAGTVFAGVKYRAFDKTPLLSGGAAVFNDLLDTTVPIDYSGPRAAHHFGSPQGGYFAGVYSPNLLHITCIQNPLTTPSLAAVNVTVPAFSPPAVLAPNLGGTGVDPLDGRTFNAAWRNNRLVTAHSIDDGTGTRSLARWYEVDTGTWPASGTPTLVQSGNIDAGPGIHSYQPAIAENATGQIGVVFARSSAAEHVGIYVAARDGSDPLGTMHTMAAVQVSAVGYSPSSNRFGDYFGADVDPSDGHTFWCAGEYATGSNTWQTWNASFTIAPCCVSPSINAIAQAASVCSTPFSSAAPTLSAGTPPITWTLTGSPPSGMTINPSTGVVSWPSPVASATPYAISVQAANTCGSDSRTWNLVVKPGDFTGEGLISPADIPSFVAALLGLPSATPCAADVNLDGFIDGRDIQAFVAGYL